MEFAVAALRFCPDNTVLVWFAESIVTNGAFGVFGRKVTVTEAFGVHCAYTLKLVPVIGVESVNAAPPPFACLFQLANT